MRLNREIKALCTMTETGATGTFQFSMVLNDTRDVNVTLSRFLAAVAGDKTNGLFFAHDLDRR